MLIRLKILFLLKRVRINKSKMENESKIVGSVFIMNGLKWKVIREGIKDWFGVECQSGNRSFISMHIDELKDFGVS